MIVYDFVKVSVACGQPGDCFNTINTCIWNVRDAHNPSVWWHDPCRICIWNYVQWLDDAHSQLAEASSASSGSFCLTCSKVLRQNLAISRRPQQYSVTQAYVSFACAFFVPGWCMLMIYFYIFFFTAPWVEPQIAATPQGKVPIAPWICKQVKDLKDIATYTPYTRHTMFCCAIPQFDFLGALPSSRALLE